VIPKARHADTTPETVKWWRDVLFFWQQNAPTNQVSVGAN
jgi:hypothetical protein